MMTKKT